ncbi:hypothetical protein AB0J35_05140 [Nonomuraea angiospora]|uniref:hypothetical protein n=1 Tax=Nonomuraea angiospora TaxID=46172 RepID=UPI00344ADE78
MSVITAVRGDIAPEDLGYTDPHAVQEGGIIPGASRTALVHEPASEVVFVGAAVVGMEVDGRRR